MTQNLTHRNSKIIPEKREDPLSAVSDAGTADDEDIIADLMEQHKEFVGSMQSRLAKLQVAILENLLMVIRFSYLAPLSFCSPLLLIYVFKTLSPL